MSNKYKKIVILSIALSQLFCSGVTYGIIFNNKTTTVNKSCDYKSPTLRDSLNLMNDYTIITNNYKNTEQKIINQISYWFGIDRINIAIDSESIEKFCSGVSCEETKQAISKFLNSVLNNRKNKHFSLFNKSDFARYYKESNSETLKNTLLEMSNKHISKSSIMNKSNIEKIIKLIDFLEISNSKVNKNQVIKELDNFSGKLLEILKNLKTVIDYYYENELSSIVSTKITSEYLFDPLKNLDNICQTLENFLFIFRSKPYREIFDTFPEAIKGTYESISNRIYNLHNDFKKNKKQKNIDNDENFRSLNGLRIFIENFTNIIEYGENNHKVTYFKVDADEFKLITNRSR